jgi:hypothetical protein
MTLPHILRASVTVLSLLTVSGAAPTFGNYSTAPDVTLSNSDQFYQAPANIESYALGAIIKHRRVPKPISLTGTSPIRPKQAWQIQYRTQNSLGKPEMGIVTVLIPFRAKPGNLFVESFLSVSSQSVSYLSNGDRTRPIMRKKSA